MQGANPNNYVDSHEVHVTINATITVAVDPKRTIDDQEGEIFEQLVQTLKNEPIAYIENKTLEEWEA